MPARGVRFQNLPGGSGARATAAGQHDATATLSAIASSSSLTSVKAEGAVGSSSSGSRRSAGKQQRAPPAVRALMAKSPKTRAALQKLYLAHQGLTELPYEALMGCSALQVLDVSHNSLGRIPVAWIVEHLPSLQRLVVSHNAIHRDGRHIRALGALQHLRSLDLRGNRIAEDRIQVLAHLFSGPEPPPENAAERIVQRRQQRADVKRHRSSGYIEAGSWRQPVRHPLAADKVPRQGPFPWLSRLDGVVITVGELREADSLYDEQQHEAEVEARLLFKSRRRGPAVDSDGADGEGTAEAPAAAAATTALSSSGDGNSGITASPSAPALTATAPATTPVTPGGHRPKSALPGRRSREWSWHQEADQPGAAAARHPMVGGVRVPRSHLIRHRQLAKQRQRDKRQQADVVKDRLAAFMESGRLDGQARRSAREVEAAVEESGKAPSERRVSLRRDVAMSDVDGAGTVMAAVASLARGTNVRLGMLGQRDRGPRARADSFDLNDDSESDEESMSAEKAAQVRMWRRRRVSLMVVARCLCLFCLTCHLALVSQCCSRRLRPIAHNHDATNDSPRDCPPHAHDLCLRAARKRASSLPLTRSRRSWRALGS